MTRSTEEAPPTLWDRSRLLARQSIMDAAMRLFAEQGFEATTIAQVAREAGVSQRTLFRYFGTKEDLIGGDQEVFGDVLRQAVAEQPARASSWAALRAGIVAVLAAHDAPEHFRDRFRLILTIPTLRARYLEKRLRWQSDLLPLIADRMGLGDQPADPRPRAVIATSFACFDAALDTWIEDDSVPLEQLYDQCVATVRGQRQPA
ncbi:TetR/AcrR family transcriptional regulator [Microlunatus parietis]|uniref:AcrR family transcriptional regulator n=1 Tax=Microlunatus parietis TaxID=682979 RepID=A0A7Y9LE03_9ACTN|nr:TetR/AcrR family transcriptional regulator [Microlunatus parietis]NYE72541.1 AcrR family transcriptional regulator [Microlunatus parietis]